MLPENLHILIIEDNDGDQLLVSDYLEQEIYTAHQKHVKTCGEAVAELTDPEKNYHLILLDLTLPDKRGEELVKEILKYNNDIPVIILSGSSDVDFSVKSLTLGVSDYLMKDAITSSSLYKSIAQTFERVRINKELELSNKRYQALFDLNPQPTLIISVKDLKILEVNAAALSKYRCSREDLLKLKIQDIQSDFDKDLVGYFLKNGNFDLKPFYVQQCFDNKKILAELKGSLLNYQGVKAIQLIAIDITQHIKHTQEVEQQNKALNDIAWQQSHLVRAPLTRLMGLIDVFEIQLKKTNIPFPEELNFLLENILNSAHEIDTVVKEIVSKTYKKD